MAALLTIQGLAVLLRKKETWRWDSAVIIHKYNKFYLSVKKGRGVLLHMESLLGVQNISILSSSIFLCRFWLWRIWRFCYIHDLGGEESQGGAKAAGEGGGGRRQWYGQVGRQHHRGCHRDDQVALAMVRYGRGTRYHSQCCGAGAGSK